MNKKWIQRKKDTISAEYDERKVFSYLKKKKKKEKNIESNPPLYPPPSQIHTHTKKNQSKTAAMHLRFHHGQ